MDIVTREERRLEVSQRRIQPVQPQRVFFPADGLGDCVEIEPNCPLELCIEATNDQGELVPWLMDEWWIGVHSFCKKRTVTVIILPTPSALFDDVILHQLEMVRRIAPHWYILGYAIHEEVFSHPNVEKWVYSPYDEIRIYENQTASTNGVHKAVQAFMASANQVTQVRGAHHARIRATHIKPQMEVPTNGHSNSQHASAHRVNHINPLEST